jgi:hypothetical protein
VKSVIHRVLNVVGRVVLACALGYCAYLGYMAWRTALRLKQVRNCADLQTLTFAVTAYREKTGRYPKSITEAVETTIRPPNKRHFLSGTDAWGNPYLYKVNGDAFILVSFGRGGVTEHLDYWKGITRPNDYARCEDLGADIFSNRSGIVRCCGK